MGRCADDINGIKGVGIRDLIRKSICVEEIKVFIYFNFVYFMDIFSEDSFFDDYSKSEVFFCGRS